MEAREAKDDALVYFLCVAPAFKKRKGALFSLWGNQTDGKQKSQRFFSHFERRLFMAGRFAAVLYPKAWVLDGFPAQAEEGVEACGGLGEAEKWFRPLLKTQDFSQIGMKRLLFDIETYKIHTSESDKRACPVGNREPICRSKRLQSKNER